VTNLPDPGAVSVSCDGQDFAGVRVIGDDAIEIACDIDEHLFRIGVGPGRAERKRATRVPAVASTEPPPAGPPAPARRQASGCSCCAVPGWS
jgi:hypothetical protein